MHVEVRRYDILDGQLDEFVARWTSGVLPLRGEFGFTIVGAWAIPGTNEFVWVVGHDTEASFADAEERYYSSTERTSMSPNPAELIEVSRKSAARRVV